MKYWSTVDPQKKALITVASSSILLCALIFGTWEYWEYRQLGSNPPSFLHRSYILRGALASLFLAGWSAFIVRLLTRKAQKDHSALEEAINHAEKLSVLGSFSAEIVHEVGNPLSVISSLVQTLREDEKDPSRQKLLNTAQGQIEHLLLSIKRIRDSIREKITLEELSAHTIISETVSLLRFDDKIGANVDLKIDAIPVHYKFRGDRWGVIQILTNLILNGSEALGKHGGKLRLSVNKIGKNTQFKVLDNGPGISEGMIDKMFQLLVTSKPDGMGVGLFVSRRIAESLGGSLTASNPSGGGAELVLSLPNIEGV